MTAAIYQTGDTIQVTDRFYSFAGVLTDLSAVPAVKLYAADKTTVSATATSFKISTGTYRAYVTLPATEGIYFLAFEGTATGTTPVNHREAIVVKFASST